MTVGVPVVLANCVSRAAHSRTWASEPGSSRGSACRRSGSSRPRGSTARPARACARISRRRSRRRSRSAGAPHRRGARASRSGRPTPRPWRRAPSPRPRGRRAPGSGGSTCRRPDRRRAAPSSRRPGRRRARGRARRSPTSRRGPPNGSRTSAIEPARRRPRRRWRWRGGSACGQLLDQRVPLLACRAAAEPLGLGVAARLARVHAARLECFHLRHAGGGTSLV